MSQPKRKYPVVSEAVFWYMVVKNERYKGFVVHKDNIYSFVLSEVIVNKKQVTEYIGEYTQYTYEPLLKYYMYKPLKTGADTIPVIQKVENNPRNHDNKNPAFTINSIFLATEVQSAIYNPSNEFGRLAFEKKS